MKTWAVSFRMRQRGARAGGGGRRGSDYMAGVGQRYNSYTGSLYVKILLERAGPPAWREGIEQSFARPNWMTLQRSYATACRLSSEGYKAIDIDGSWRVQFEYEVVVEKEEQPNATQRIWRPMKTKTSRPQDLKTSRPQLLVHSRKLHPLFTPTASTLDTPSVHLPHMKPCRVYCRISPLLLLLSALIWTSQTAMMSEAFATSPLSIGKRRLTESITSPRSPHSVVLCPSCLSGTLPQYHRRVGSGAGKIHMRLSPEPMNDGIIPVSTGSADRDYNADKRKLNWWIEWKERLMKISNIASVLCVIDCTALPIITLLLPLLGLGASPAQTEWLHELGHRVAMYFVLPALTFGGIFLMFLHSIYVLVVLVGGMAGTLNYLSHRKIWTSAPAALGLFMIYLANGDGGILSLLPHALAHSLHCGSVLHRIVNIAGCALLLRSNYMSHRLVGCAAVNADGYACCPPQSQQKHGIRQLFGLGRLSKRPMHSS
eukprot:scaffold49244_cov52-Attheya_sp.AAC.9